MFDFETRRQKIFDLMDEDSIMVIFSGVSKIESEDDSYPFSVNRNFYYLTGITQENSVLMLIKGIGEKKEYLFVDEYDETKEKWTGHRISFDDARKISGMNNVQPSTTFNALFELAISNKDNVYGAISKLYLDLTPEIKIGYQLSTVEFSKNINAKYDHLRINNCRDMFVGLRGKKDDQEIAAMYEAINYTNLGLGDLILNMHSGMKEHELSDRFEFFGRSHGRLGLAFSTITAAGANAVILHHPINQQDNTIEEGNLVLFDLGFAYKGYSADVSRTYPISGKFTPLQKKIYEAVLHCNKAVIEYAKPGLSILNLQEFAIKDLTASCLEAGLIENPEDIRKYYYHNVSHHLGLDTHDIMDRAQPLEVGNVITVEPGLYFKELGIGVRIEDDVLITENGCKVLTSNIKKEVEDIEKMFRGKVR